MPIAQFIFFPIFIIVRFMSSSANLVVGTVSVELVSAVSPSESRSRADAQQG
jgi:hypothetical protein